MSNKRITVSLEEYNRFNALRAKLRTSKFSDLLEILEYVVDLTTEGEVDEFPKALEKIPNPHGKLVVVNAGEERVYFRDGKNVTYLLKSEIPSESRYPFFYDYEHLPLTEEQKKLLDKLT